MRCAGAREHARCTVHQRMFGYLVARGAKVTAPLAAPSAPSATSTAAARALVQRVMVAGVASE
jgi:hypothetical protein